MATDANLISHILWLFYLRFVSGKTKNKTEEKQEITFFNNFFCFFYILYLFSSFRQNFKVIVQE